MLPLPFRAGMVGGFSPLQLVRAGGFWLQSGKNWAGAPDPELDTWGTQGFLVDTFVPGLIGGGAASGLPPARTTLGGKAITNFAGGTVLDGHVIQTQLAASNFAFMHQAVTIFLAARSDGAHSGVILSTSNQGVGESGISLAFNNGTNALDVFLSNAGGTYAITDRIQLTPFGKSISAMHIYEVTFSVAAGYAIQVDGDTPTIGALASVSGANPTSGLIIGSIAAGSVSYLFGDIGDLVVIPGVASLSQRNALRRYLASWWSVPLA